MTTTTQEFAARRKRLLKQLGKDNAAILFSASECLRNGDVHFPFRQNSDFYYLTDFPEPEAVAILLPERADGEFILFNRARNPQLERWLGPSAGQQGACEIYGANQAFDIGQLDEKILELLKERRAIFYELGKNKDWDQKMSSWVSKLQAAHRKSIPCPTQLSDLTLITHEMRLVKNPSEISSLKKVAEISALAHAKLMKICAPGRFEYELEAEFEYEIGLRGCRFTAYPTIVGGGSNACVLHYVENKDRLKDGDLVLVDAGGEYEHYAADITRTFPVNGKFSKDQALLYDVVLEAQLAVINAIRPGLQWNCLQEIAVEHLVSGMVKLGIIPGPVKEAIEKKTYQEYYMHNIGHWLGLDVHDAGSYKMNGQWRSLEAGMMLTVEPGLYLSANERLDRRWWNIGIRIEDDVLVTPKGCEVLTKDAPKTIKEIEALMR